MKYKDKKAVKGTGLEKDHTPSAAALRKAAENKIKKHEGAGEVFTDDQRKKILKSVVDNAQTIAIPPDIHAEGDTWRYKNTKEQVETDSLDLNKAAKSNTEKISDAMKNKEHGCSKAYAEAAAKILQIDWNKYIEDIVQNTLKGSK